MQTKHIVLAGVAMLAAAGLAVAGPKPAGGTISGKVTYEGTPAKMKPIDMSKEPSCAKMYPTPPLSEAVVTGQETLWKTWLFSFRPERRMIPRLRPRRSLTRRAAVYTARPGVSGNQELKIVNEDQTSHNIHPLPKLNREWNKSQPPGTPPIQREVRQSGIHPREVQRASLDAWHLRGAEELPLCGDRRWRHVLAAEPASGKYTMTAWHESYGEQSQEVTISGSETKNINFVFKAKPY